ncbi:MAG: hypothetical protein ABSB19_16010, partial [Methylomonas sp.]
MLNRDTQAQLLRNYPMLQALSPAQLADLFVHTNLINLPANTVVFDENQLCQGFPMLLSGAIRVIKTAANGRELQLYRVQ